VLARLHRPPGEISMRLRRRGDDHRRYGRVVEHHGKIVGHGHVRIERGSLLAPIFGEFDQVPPAVAAVGVQIPGQVRAPVPEADLCDAVHVVPILLPASDQVAGVLPEAAV
jgi:hypothetical protein